MPPKFAFFVFCIQLLGMLGVQSSIEQTPQKMEEHSRHIEYPKIHDLTDLELYNERGLKHFFQGEYETALEDFNFVFNALYNNSETEKSLFGTALWGRLLSNAYSNHEKDAYADLQLIRLYFLRGEHCSSCSKRAIFNENSEYQIIHTAKFANPNECITSAECKERVRGTANVMRMLTLRIPSRTLAGTINLTISELEHAAYGCCDRAHWTECLGPIIDAWNYLKDAMDKGVAIAPYVVGPGI